MDPLVIFMGYSRALYQPVLERQLDAAGVPWEFFYSGEFSWRWRVMKTLEVARANKDLRIILVDSCDVLFVGTKDSLAEILRDAPPLIFSGQRECWPLEDRRDDYELLRRTSSPHRYVNAGALAGVGWALSRAIEYGMRHYPIQTDDMSKFHDSDAAFYTRLYLDRFGLVDENCNLFQTLRLVPKEEMEVVDGRLHNVRFCTYPPFVHACGHTPFPAGLNGAEDGPYGESR